MNQERQESHQAGEPENSRAGQSAPQSERTAATAAPPEELKPWYYQYWFLYPTIIFWPLWPVLILRSPWHNGMVSGSVAWAMLISGSYIFYRLAGGSQAINRIQAGDQWALVSLQIIIPGLILIVVTQIHWIKNRRRIKEAAVSVPSINSTSNSAATGESNAERRRPRGPNRKRGRRRR